MAESIADMMHRHVAEVVRVEYALVERLIGAFAEETGRFPRVVTDDQRWWCDGFNDHEPTAADWEKITAPAATYRAEADILATTAMLVRVFDGLEVTWRWEERK